MFAARAGAAARLAQLDAKLNEEREEEFQGSEEDDDDDDVSSEDDDQGYVHKRKSLRMYIKGLKNDCKECYPLSLCFKKNESDKPEDYYRNPEYHEEKSVILLKYLEVAERSYQITNNEHFSNIIVFFIIVAGINVGVQTYDNIDTFPFEVLDVIILIIFAIEVMYCSFVETRYVFAQKIFVVLSLCLTYGCQMGFPLSSHHK